MSVCHRQCSCPSEVVVKRGSTVYNIHSNIPFSMFTCLECGLIGAGSNSSHVDGGNSERIFCVFLQLRKGLLNCATRDKGTIEADWREPGRTCKVEEDSQDGWCSTVRELDFNGEGGEGGGEREGVEGGSTWENWGKEGGM